MLGLRAFQPFPGIVLLFATLVKRRGWVSRYWGGDGRVLHRNVRADDEVGGQAEPSEDERGPGQLLKARLWGWYVAEPMDGRGFKEFFENFHRSLHSIRAWYLLCQITQLAKKKSAQLTSAGNSFCQRDTFQVEQPPLIVDREQKCNVKCYPSILLLCLQTDQILIRSNINNLLAVLENIHCIDFLGWL